MVHLQMRFLFNLPTREYHLLLQVERITPGHKKKIQEYTSLIGHVLFCARLSFSHMLTYHFI